MSEWFLSHGGKKSGPLRAKQITRLIAGGAFRADDAMVWKEGMSYWQTVADSGLLAEAALEPDAQKNDEAEKATGQSPYKAPKASLTPAKEQLGDVVYGGFGRLLYFFAPLGVALFLVLLLAFGFGSDLKFDVSETEISRTEILFFLGVVAVIVWIDLARLKNLGMSGWWVLAEIVPFLNLWLNWRLTACPEGYANHRQLDMPGKILTFLFVILPLAGIAFIWLSAAGASLMGR